MTTKNPNRLFGIRGRVESLSMMTGEGDEVTVEVYSDFQSLRIRCGRIVAEGLKLGDPIQIWVERAPAAPGKETKTP